MKITVSPQKKEIQVEIVLGLPNGNGDISSVLHFLNFDFIISENIKPEKKHINKPEDNQNKGSSIAFNC